MSTGAEQGSRWKRRRGGVGKGQDTVGLGIGVGWIVGSGLGSLVGAGLGRSVGAGLGRGIDLFVGIGEGTEDGCRDGMSVGVCEPIVTARASSACSAQASVTGDGRGLFSRDESAWAPVTARDLGCAM
jgi:hypothetical protein